MDNIINEKQNMADKKWSKDIDSKQKNEDNSNNNGEPKTVVEEIQRLNKELEDAKIEHEKTKDQLLRAVAEVENIKRRAQKDVQDANNFAISAFAKDLLSSADNMFRAMESFTDEMKENNPDVMPFVTGVEMTQKELISAFEKNGIKRINPIGEKFDYNFHQAMSQVEDNEKEPNTILQVIQSGYMIKDRLLRPAMVIISKQSANKE